MLVEMLLVDCVTRTIFLERKGFGGRELVVPHLAVRS